MAAARRKRSVWSGLEPDPLHPWRLTPGWITAPPQSVDAGRNGYRGERIRGEELAMSSDDKLANKAQELAGRGKETLGAATHDRDLEAEGKKDQAAGNLKQAGEKIKDAFK